MNQDLLISCGQVRFTPKDGYMEIVEDFNQRFESDDSESQFLQVTEDGEFDFLSYRFNV